MATTARRYPRGASFPNEGFVQAAIEACFKAQGYELDTSGDADLVCRHGESGKEWIIEAKGQTSDVGLDFRTGLGQILQRMADRRTQYGVAVPNTPQFMRQCRRISPWVRESLGLHWLIVDSDGTVTIREPSGSL